MKSILLSLSIFCFSTLLCAQDFIPAGVITYERKTNLWSNLSDNYFQDFKSTIPEWETSEFTLTFSPDEALYAPKTGIKKRISNPPGYENIVYSDLKSGTSISYKSLFENDYLIQGKLRNAVWKIKDDFREIAGFNCRRATTIIMDSVFVVAFYTDKIIPSTGPESFSGLPGTILGLVINRIHTSWYATKIDITNIPEINKVSLPSKGRKVSAAEFIAVLPELTRNSGSSAQRMIWFSEI